MDQWLIYGANGYTGALIAEEAARRGHRPLLAGRSADKLRPLAERLKLDFVAFDLADAPRVLRDREIGLVLHAAGPYLYTSRLMLDACLQVGAHYLDLTGEIPVFQNTLAHDRAAKERGTALISGVGFDIVPSDCLLAYVGAQVDAPQSATLVISGLGMTGGGLDASGGTLKTNLEMIAAGFVVRRDNALVPVDVGAGLRQFRFAEGMRSALIVPWGDVVTTAIPNLTAYMTFAPEEVLAVRVFGFALQRLLRIQTLRGWASRAIGAMISGPSEHIRQTVRAQLYAQVTGRGGQRAEAWLETIEPYQFTMLAAVNAVERVMQENPAGALSPAQAFGADFVLQVEKTVRRDTL